MGETDGEILNKQGDIRRWIHIPVEDESEASNADAIAAVTRKLSIISTSGRSIAPPRDGMTMGQKTEAQIEAISIAYEEAREMQRPDGALFAEVLFASVDPAPGQKCLELRRHE